MINQSTNDASNQPIGELTLDQWRVVSGTPDRPAVCGICREYALVYNKCLYCGRDDRVRYGCQHRIGLGEKCDECRLGDQIEEITAAISATTEGAVAHSGEMLWLLHRFSRLKLKNNYSELLALQGEATKLFEKIKLSSSGIKFEGKRRQQSTGMDRVRRHEDR